MKDDFKNLPHSVKEARLEGSLYYFTGKPCKRGHISKRVTLNMACWECKKEFGRATIKTHKDTIAAYLNKQKGRSAF
jgi:ribosomal protein L44E